MSLGSHQQKAQPILKVRRHYNQWVANETLEDYALRFTARKSRHMSISKVGKTALGATAFLALESIAAAVTLTYGFTNTVAAIFAVCTIFFLTGLPIAYYCAKHGLDIDLLTRGAGFGYLGSTITSLIYASFTFIFFAIEAVILSSALNLVLGIPLAVGYLLCTLAVIPIVMRGITAISRFQVGTQSLWLVLQIAALVIVCGNEWQQFEHWMTYAPVQLPQAQAFNWVLFGAAASVMFALIAQIGEQVDYLRFMPEKTEKNRKQWWFWMTFAGPGWVFIGVVKMLFGSFLAYLALSEGVSFVMSSDPTLMYQRAFQYLLGSETAALLLAGVMVIISQMKINVTNAYAGSIAWSNFFSRLTHSHPGRVVWLVFNVLLALLLMELGIYKALESVLSVFALVAVSWLCCLSADLVINKPLGLSPKQIEFKRGYLYDINPVGTLSMVLASAVGFLAYLGVFGESLKTLGHFLSIATCFVSMPLLAWLTKGRFYLAREIEPIASDKAPADVACSICQNAFETEDLLHCPAYQQTICSLCCSLDARCLDQCKPNAKGIFERLSVRLPSQFAKLLLGRTGQFIAWFTIVNTILAALLALIYQHMALQNIENLNQFADGLWTLFFTLLIVSGVVTWLFLLAHESRVVAQQESNRQTQKLVDEIEAHKVTDEQLQQSKELAERASAAKSRYVSGISHELRTPLQSILGYAQLLSERDDTPPAHSSGLKTIRRSGQYLADLIEGLLDVSKIEAGRLELHPEHFMLPDLMNQLDDMFQMQASAKGIGFKLAVHGALPQWVNADEKRVRQVLINLLSNAVKYTHHGGVECHIRYKSQIAQIDITDTGVGIDEADMERIFSPFERVQPVSGHNEVPGTGLGLTIVKLLLEIMGGDLQVESVVGQGSRFKIKLMLPSVDRNRIPDVPQLNVSGYHGEVQTITVIDDDATVRGLLSDLLTPLGFLMRQANRAQTVMSDLASFQADAYIIDVNMPGHSGFELASWLRSQAVTAPIIMLSANAQVPDATHKKQVGYDAYLVKPISNQALLTQISGLLGLSWQVVGDPINKGHIVEVPSKTPIELPLNELTQALLGALDIGYKTGVCSALQTLHQSNMLNDSQFNELFEYAQTMRLQRVIERIMVGKA